MNPAKPIPLQREADLNDPEEHLAWAMRNMPSFAGIGAVTHSGFLRKWSEHLFKAGFRHTSWLVRLADENGNIHVSKLPRQQIKFQEAFRGPRHTYNNAARWVSMDTPEDAPVQIQDLSRSTRLEQEIYAEQLRQLGVVPTPEIPEHRAQELNEGH